MQEISRPFPNGDTDIRKAKGVRLQIPISSTNKPKIAEF
jgi:hypothetical protein